MKHVLVLVLLSSLPQGPPAPDWQDDFPPQDSSLVWSLARAYERIDADHRFETAPADIGTIRALALAGDCDRLLASLRLIVDKHPERLAEALRFISLHELRGDTEQVTRHRDALLRIVADGRQRLDSLSREDAARVARAIVTVEDSLTRHDDPAHRLRTLVDRYQGTEAALLAEVDLIMIVHTPSPEMIAALDAFVERHPGTTAAAKAIYQKGFQYSSSNMNEYQPRDADPIAHFERVEAAVRELESGRYPQSYWTRQAPALIQGFSIFDRATISPRSLERLIAAFEDFAKDQFDAALRSEQQGLNEYVITSKLPRLYARRGDRTAQFEQFLSMLERSTKAPAAVALLRASYYLQAQDRETPEQRQSRLAKAKTALRTASGAGDEAGNRRALATIAAMEFQEGHCEAALPALREYVARFPATPWTWVAQVRIGQCEDAAGEFTPAIAAFRLASSAGADLPPARVLGHAYAGRVLEATGDIEAARDEYQRALDAWDNRFGQSYSTHVQRLQNPENPFSLGPDTAEIPKGWLIDRVSALTQALATPGGTPLAQARALLARGDFEEAETMAGRVLTDHPVSSVSADARYVLSLARLERGLVLANADHPDHDPARARAILDALSTQPVDFAVAAARMARATLRWLQGDNRDAQERELKAALADWHAQQVLREPSSDIEADLANIRQAVFLPRGGGVYAKTRWNAFTWSDVSAPFFIVNADLQVKLADGESRRYTIASRLPESDRVLFLETAQIELLERIIDSLGGTKVAEPTHIMQTPNQPVGGARQIVTLWSRLFPARPGHWGGWELETYPVITEIAFTNAERTKATAKVTIGYSGGTVELEKEAGRWIARRIAGFWIT